MDRMPYMYCKAMYDKQESNVLLLVPGIRSACNFH
jgi:hypothetical protein